MSHETSEVSVAFNSKTHQENFLQNVSSYQDLFYHWCWEKRTFRYDRLVFQGTSHLSFRADCLLTKIENCYSTGSSSACAICIVPQHNGEPAPHSAYVCRQRPPRLFKTRHSLSSVTRSMFLHNFMLFTVPSLKFIFLQAILCRKLNAPELTQIMATVQEMSVKSEQSDVQSKCRKVWRLHISSLYTSLRIQVHYYFQALMTYLLDYPLDGRTMEGHMKFLARQLEYEYEAGRMSAMETMNNIFKLFPKVCQRWGTDLRCSSPLIRAFLAEHSRHSRHHVLLAIGPKQIKWWFCKMCQYGFREYQISSPKGLGLIN